MINIIKADLFRIFRRKGIYIIAIILAVSTLFSAYALMPAIMGFNLSGQEETYGLSEEWLQKLYETRSISETREIILEHGSYEADVLNVAHNNNLYYVFIAVVVFAICCDFSNRTIKNTVSMNISKRKYYFSKLALVFGLSTILLFFNSYCGYFMNLLLNGSKFVSSFTNITLLTVRQLPVIFAIISVLMMITVITRKTAIYNGIVIPLVIVFQLLLMAGTKLLKLPKAVTDYEFEVAMGKLCFDPGTSYMVRTLGVWTVILIVTSFLGYSYFKKKDI